jgi:SAM-dependent methyltransferase
MSFNVGAEVYDRFMGRYSIQLSPQLADLAAVVAGQTALDVGCGPGALTGELAKRLGPEAVSAVDPSEPFVAAIRERYPAVSVQIASAERLPFPDRVFDVSLAQLVVHFMKDPVAGLAEMARVTRPGGVVAACVWDYGGGAGPLSPFWKAAHQLDPDIDDESQRPGVRQGHLMELFEAAGLEAVEGTSFASAVEHPTFEDWWEPFTFGVGPAGSFIASLDPERQLELRELARGNLDSAPFVLSPRAWAARGVV